MTTTVWAFRSLLGRGQTEHLELGGPIPTLSETFKNPIKPNKAIAVEISLVGDGQLKGISAAGAGTKKDPKYVALQVVIDKMNDLFGAESFAESQVREFVQGSSSGCSPTRT